MFPGTLERFTDSRVMTVVKKREVQKCITGIPKITSCLRLKERSLYRTCLTFCIRNPSVRHVVAVLILSTNPPLATCRLPDRSYSTFYSRTNTSPSWQTQKEIHPTFCFIIRMTLGKSQTPNFRDSFECGDIFPFSLLTRRKSSTQTNDEKTLFKWSFSS